MKGWMASAEAVAGGRGRRGDDDEEDTEGQNEFDIKARVYQNIERLQQRGAVVIMPSRTRAYSVDTALAMLVRRHLVVEANGQYAPEQKGKNVLSYYANSIGSWQE